MKKIMLCPYFGELPHWMDKYEKPEGYDMLIDTNLESFKKRVQEKLGLDYPGLPGTGKVWDYRCALGFLYEEEIKGYDFWGHTDFDMVYGDIEKFFPDSFLENLDIHSNHGTYICGPWTVYRNTPKVNELFKWGDWEYYMSSPEPNGWVEKEYSRIVEGSGLRYKYTFLQGDPYTTNPNLEKVDGKLFQDGVEIPMFHFRRSKRWPL